MKTRQSATANPSYEPIHAPTHTERHISHDPHVRPQRASAKDIILSHGDAAFLRARRNHIRRMLRTEANPKVSAYLWALLPPITTC